MSGFYRLEKTSAGYNSKLVKTAEDSPRCSMSECCCSQQAFGPGLAGHLRSTSHKKQ